MTTHRTASATHCTATRQETAMPVMPATTVPTRTDNACPYCTHYGRACGRHDDALPAAPLLTFDTAEDGYIVHVDGGATTPAPIMEPLYFWSDVDLQSEWLTAVARHRETSGQSYYWSTPDRDEWWAALRRTIVECDDVDIDWCEDCRDPFDAENMTSTRDGDVCEGCHDENYMSCDDCGESSHRDRSTYTLGDRSVCGSCSSYYSYCEDCDGYYHDDDESEHRHNGGCDCAPPTYSLTLPNGTDGTLSADQRVTVGLPAGVISDEGLRLIADVVRTHVYGLSYEDDVDGVTRNKWWNFYYELPTLDAAWQTREGNYTKRLSKLAHKSQAIKVPAEMVAKIGNIARDNSKGADVTVEMTRQLNLSAEDFYHEDSCWWQSYAESRCSLKSNGGIGMRSFGGYAGNEVTGRAWIMPLRSDGDQLVPTFDGATADAYMVFNGYGDLSGYTPARILSGMAGMSYRKVGFSCDPMYVNGSTGYLVAPEALVDKHVSGVTLYSDTHSSLYRRETTAVSALVAVA